ncbi:ArsR family transcriptional regulator [Actinoplanes sp. NPDC049668]|uniref:arsenate reductase/protein-tyrosine-phosphatase family protein n=1 Tax=unclassified Actinoplanes TaxID=2626549 RepID=UPI0033BB3AEE
MERVPRDAAVTAPEFMKLAGHPLRWRVLGELARSDRQVHELTGLVEQPQNLVSYHLGKLRAGRLVTTRRSSADRRDTYYTIDLARCGELLAATGAALHPGLHLVPPTPAVVMPHRGPGPRVLFLCTGNSARSQMAEALLQHLSAGSVTTFSAGSHPKQLHPDAVRVMAEHGIDLSGHRAKHLDEFTGRRFTTVVTLCDRVREICPEFPGHPDSVHWSIPDPARDPDGYPAFQRLAAELRTRIGFLLHRLVNTPTLEAT